VPLLAEITDYIDGWNDRHPPYPREDLTKCGVDNVRAGHELLDSAMFQFTGLKLNGVKLKLLVTLVTCSAVGGKFVSSVPFYCLIKIFYISQGDKQVYCGTVQIAENAKLEAEVRAKYNITACICYFTVGCSWTANEICHVINFTILFMNKLCGQWMLLMQ